MKRLNEKIYTPEGGPPQVPPPQGLWKKMGNERIYALSAAFYRQLEQSPIREMFPEDMQAASRNQALFLIQALGGPSLYSETRGAPAMRRRHLPFLIDANARQVWLDCFKQTLGDGAEWDLNPGQTESLLAWLTAFSSWMENHQP